MLFLNVLTVLPPKLASLLLMLPQEADEGIVNELVGRFNEGGGVAGADLLDRRAGHRLRAYHHAQPR